MYRREEDGKRKIVSCENSGVISPAWIVDHLSLINGNVLHCIRCQEARVEVSSHAPVMILENGAWSKAEHRLGVFERNTVGHVQINIGYPLAWQVIQEGTG